MIPCERNTLTPEFSTCRKFVRGRVNVALLWEINANFRDFNFHYFGPKFSKYFWCCWHLRKRGLLHVSGKLPTYPSLKLTSALASHLGQNVGLGEGKVGSFPWSERGVSYQGGVPSVSLKTEKNSRCGQISSLDLPFRTFRESSVKFPFRITHLTLSLLFKKVTSWYFPSFWNVTLSLSLFPTP